MGKRLLVATIVAIGSLLAFAQNVISGHIKDVRTGEPLIGASVIVKSEKVHYCYYFEMIEIMSQNYSFFSIN